MAAAKRKRTPKSYAAVAAVSGAGKATPKQLTAAVTEFIESVDGEILWVLPDGDNTKSVDRVVDFLWDEQASFVLVTDDADELEDDFRDGAEDVVEVDETSEVDEELVTQVVERADGDTEKFILLVLDPEHEGDQTILGAAFDAGLTALDLSSGLIRLEEAEDDDGEDAAPESEEQDAPDDDDDDDDAPDVPEDAPVTKLPDEAREAFNDGNYEVAADALAEALKGPKIKKLAAELGVAVEKGQWAKTIAVNIIDKLAGTATVDEPREDAEDAPAKEEPKKRAPRKQRGSKETEDVASPPATSEETQHAIVTYDAENVAKEAPATTSQGREFAYALKVEVIRAAAYVAGQKGTVEAKKFLDALETRALDKL